MFLLDTMLDKVKPSAPFERIYTQYESQCAKKRNYAFELSKDQFQVIIFKPCHYCGLPPSRKMTRGRHTIFYNGVDRKDNTKGYTLENSLPCCLMCNRAKMALPYDEFLAWLDRAYQHTHRFDVDSDGEDASLFLSARAESYEQVVM